MLGVMLVLLI